MKISPASFSITMLMGTLSASKRSMPRCVLQKPGRFNFKWPSNQQTGRRCRPRECDLARTSRAVARSRTEEYGAKINRIDSVAPKEMV